MMYIFSVQRPERPQADRFDEGEVEGMVIFRNPVFEPIYGAERGVLLAIHGS